MRSRYPEDNEIFNHAMHALSAATARGLAEGYDFSRFSTLADLGGGDGTLISAVLTRHRGLRGVIFDLPHVVIDAPSRLMAAGVADHCEIVAGSFFDVVPVGCEAYVLKSILHDWDDDASVRILERVRDSTKPGTALLIVEGALVEQHAGPLAAMSDLNMMLMAGGKERTLTRWRALTDASGVAITYNVDVGAGWWVIGARRV